MEEASLLLATAQTERLSYATQTETAQQLVDAQAAEEAVDDAAQPEAVEELADQPQNTAEQQTDRSDDLEQRLGEESPQGTELFLGVRHVRNPLLGVVDGFDDGRRQLLERFGKSVLLFRGFAAGRSCFGVGGNGSVGIETSDGAIAFLQDPVALFKHGLDVLDELLFVKLLLGGSVGFLNPLLCYQQCVHRVSTETGTDLGDVLTNRLHLV